MGAVQGKRTVFSTHLCIGGQQSPTHSRPRHFQSGAQRQPCGLHPSGAPTHLPLSRPFCCREVIAGSNVTRGKFHARYIRLHPGKG